MMERIVDNIHQTAIATLIIAFLVNLAGEFLPLYKYKLTKPLHKYSGHVMLVCILILLITSFN